MAAQLATSCEALAAGGDRTDELERRLGEQTALVGFEPSPNPHVLWACCEVQ